MNGYSARLGTGITGPVARRLRLLVVLRRQPLNRATIPWKARQRVVASLQSLCHPLGNLARPRVHFAAPLTYRPTITRRSR
jgi:hypothetical protein